MSLLNKTPYLNTILNGLTKAELVSLKESINGSSSFVHRSLDDATCLLSADDKMKAVNLSLSATTDSVNGWFLGSSFIQYYPDRDMIQLYSIDLTKMRFKVINEPATATDLRQILDSLLIEKGEGGDTPSIYYVDDLGSDYIDETIANVVIGDVVVCDTEGYICIFDDGMEKDLVKTDANGVTTVVYMHEEIETDVYQWVYDDTIETPIGGGSSDAPKVWVVGDLSSTPLSADVIEMLENAKTGDIVFDGPDMNGFGLIDKTDDSGDAVTIVGLCIDGKSTWALSYLKTQGTWDIDSGPNSYHIKTLYKHRVDFDGGDSTIEFIDTNPTPLTASSTGNDLLNRLDNATAVTRAVFVMGGDFGSVVYNPDYVLQVGNDIHAIEFYGISTGTGTVEGGGDDNAIQLEAALNNFDSDTVTMLN